MEEPLVIPSVLEEAAGPALRGIRGARRECPLVELRADHLRVGETARVVREAGRPLVVTVRTTRQGGFFDGSDEERWKILLAGIMAGARYVDVEWEPGAGPWPLGIDPARIVLSHHGAPCRTDTLLPLYRSMAATPAARLKVVPVADSIAEIGAVRDLLRSAGNDGRALACFAMGRSGSLSRLLALRWGSWSTFAAPTRGRETAPGQFTVDEMLDVHDPAGIGEGTRFYGLAGAELSGSPSPAMHDAGYREAGLDARYLPLEIAGVDELAWLADPSGPVGLRGFGVTIPFKSEAARRCRPADRWSRESGSVNTVQVERDGWAGYNTDASGMAARIRQVLDPAGLRARILGVGGTARAMASVLRSAGAEVTMVARRGGDTAWETRNRPGAEILVNATPLGRDGEEAVAEAGLPTRLCIDAVYAPGATPLARSARQRGVPVLDGIDFLVAQAVDQFRILTGQTPNPATLREAAERFLARSTGA